MIIKLQHEIKNFSRKNFSKFSVSGLQKQTGGLYLAHWLTLLANYPEIERSNRADSHGPLTVSNSAFAYPPISSIRHEARLNVCEPATIQARVTY